MRALVRDAPLKLLGCRLHYLVYKVLGHARFLSASLGFVSFSLFWASALTLVRSRRKDGREAHARNLGAVRGRSLRQPPAIVAAGGKRRCMSPRALPASRPAPLGDGVVVGRAGSPQPSTNCETPPRTPPAAKPSSRSVIMPTFWARAYTPPLRARPPGRRGLPGGVPRPPCGTGATARRGRPAWWTHDASRTSATPR
jgi:hypothetical protein